jgi:hypothetical protein
MQLLKNYYFVFILSIKMQKKSSILSDRYLFNKKKKMKWIPACKINV